MQASLSFRSLGRPCTTSDLSSDTPSERRGSSPPSGPPASSRRLAGLLIVSVLAGGCTTLSDYLHNGFKVGPNYGRPPAPVAKDWIDAADVRVRKDEDDLSKWWTVFHDPVLDSLIG